MKSQRPILVAIVGGSGSGKSWLSEKLAQRLGKLASRLSQDDFYQDRSHLTPAQCARVNFDHPRAIDWKNLETVLKNCLHKRPTRIPQYDFSTHARRKSELAWNPRPIVLVDGLWLLHRPTLRTLFDLRIFVECPERLRLERRIKRDQQERGRSEISIRKQFSQKVCPMHARYVEPQRRWADRIVSATAGPAEIQTLAEDLRPASRRRFRPVCNLTPIQNSRRSS